MNDITSRFIEVYIYLLSINKVSSAADFAKKIGISTSLMNEVSKGRSNIGITAIQNTVNNFNQINLEWLIKGKGRITEDFKIPELNYDPNEEFAIKTRGIPLIPMDAFAGVGFNLEHLVLLDQIEERYVIPLFSSQDVDFLITVRGNSMYPTFNSGDVVGCRLITERIFLQWNKIHVIYSKSQGVLIKRLRKSTSQDDIICRSDNSDYEDFNIPIDDVQNIAIVIGSVRLE